MAALCLTVLVGARVGTPSPALSPATPSPPSFLSRLQAPGPGFTGTVVEEVPAGGYRYLRVAETHGPQRWVVALDRGPLLGRDVSVRPFGTTHDFLSRRTTRRFATLDFAIVHPTESP